MDDLIVEFLTETNESLMELDTDLIKLEQNPNDKDLISKIFRLMHTIKGTCGFLGLPRLETVAHRAENVLGRFRDGNLEVTPAYVSLILESLDRVRYLLGHIEETGTEPEGEDSDLTEKLDAVYEGRDGGTETTNVPAATAPGPVEVEVEFPSIQEEHGEEIASQFATAKTEIPTAAAQTQTKETTESAIANQSLRVNMDVLENLMTMVSELVLTRNQLLQIARTEKENNFVTPLQRLNHVVSDLQEGVMKTRMQPIGNAWAKLPRIIRDLSIELGKKIDLEMTGQDTELDRQVLDMIKDPLTHMVRNSGDHGIETPVERTKAGKPETGKIQLRAYHEGGHIIIEIADDGKGLPTEKIRQKIISNGLANEEEAMKLSPQQIHQFIFHAGFSTADKVTSVSGRGVGMDVVRTNIEKIGGSIEMKSAEGKGSTFYIKIPLTLAIVSSLIVESAGERFAIPQLAVRELVLVSQKSENRIEMIRNTPVFRLRDKLLPLVSLEDLLKLGSNTDTDMTTRFEHKYIIVTQVGNYSFGLIVDQVFDTEEIVVKPVAKILKNIELFSGNTILGDGSVIMILDPGGIAKVTGENNVTDSAGDTAEDHRRVAADKKTSLLLFTAGQGAPKAVPLSLISRLENIEVSSIEQTDGQMLVQYRGSLMPILPFSHDIDLESASAKPLLVFADRGKSVGLIVDEIVDIREETIEIQLDGKRQGVFGSAIISGKATEIVDVMHFLNSVHGDWFKDHGDEPYLQHDKRRKNGESSSKRILLVDDSPFFRNMLCPLLTAAGYDVVAVEGPSKALELTDSEENFDIIISDIEMPDMNGYDFATRVRANEKWQNTPMVALTSHATPEDIDHGYESGFNEYIAKFDRDTLLSTISKTLSRGIEA
ncbi:MAG: chemotaxis protein CheW [Pseudobdellovibrionaceae bacterium]|nr:chemotaxis protein CheW [Pseudobdellovibrionaceae bacterium]